MRKHRNHQQEVIFVDFMENNEDIARGYVKGDRVAKELLWESLAEKLNSSGPPTKDCSGWKKTWTDWKAYVKNKMSHNKKENQKTGGGQFNKYVLSDVEESVARLSGIYRSVEGIIGAREFAEPDVTLVFESEEENNNGFIQTVRTSTQSAGKFLQIIDREGANLDVSYPSLPSTSKNALKYGDLLLHNTKKQGEEQTPNDKNCTKSSRKRLNLTPSPNLNRKKPRTCTPKNVPQHDLNNLLFEENNHLQSIVKLMEKQQEELKSQNRKLGRLCDIFKNYFDDKKRHDKEIYKLFKEKNEIKVKLLEIEALKLEIQKDKSKQI